MTERDYGLKDIANLLLRKGTLQMCQELKLMQMIAGIKSVTSCK